MHLSSLKLHQFRYGELAADEVASVTGHLDGCERCKSRYQAQLSTRAEFEVLPVPQAIRALDAKAAPRASWVRWVAALFVPVAVAAAVMIVVSPNILPIEPEPTVRTKGALPALEVWVKADNGARPLGVGEAVGEGTAVQLLVDAKGASFVALAGTDGTGSIELFGQYAPSAGLAPAPVALVLDGAPGPQRFYAVSSDRVLSPEEVRRAISQQVDGVSVTMVEVAKR